MKQAVRAILVRDGKLLVMKRTKFGRLYYTLIGGGIDRGEDAQTALRRELREETGMEVGALRHVYTEDAGDMYGVQYIFWCEDIGGEPLLTADSEEAITSAFGQNLYEPSWLALSELPAAPFRSESVKQALLAALKTGFPAEAQTLAWQAESVSS